MYFITFFVATFMLFAIFMCVMTFLCWHLCVFIRVFVVHVASVYVSNQRKTQKTIRKSTRKRPKISGYSVHFHRRYNNSKGISKMKKNQNTFMSYCHHKNVIKRINVVGLFFSEKSC